MFGVNTMTSLINQGLYFKEDVRCHIYTIYSKEWVKPGIILHIHPLRPIQKIFNLNVTSSGARIDLQNNPIVTLRYISPVVQMQVLTSEFHLNVQLSIYHFFPSILI